MDSPDAGYCPPRSEDAAAVCNGAAELGSAATRVYAARRRPLASRTCSTANWNVNAFVAGVEVIRTVEEVLQREQEATPLRKPAQQP
jgi:hypothetical protein